ncbi:FliI/YscN family ATPase [Pigmentibacter sp. JX0631]|uniref:FliI/YscN family ATPase n=1 Tax=Pigmentibacter sp. JX0631 TaxID=2976982 RepID=UPI0024686B70|nr:FliI/YscN family ATPase [Pigmentibacter sp. JX0631]WGL59454.1 FliI/YscN family ATPase [Pigmentibacter sp. JX0631]
MFSNNALAKIKKQREVLQPQNHFENFGKVVQIVGTVIEVTLADAPLGALVKIFNREKTFAIEGEIVGFRKEKSLVIPFSDPAGVCANSYVQCIEREPKILVGDHLIGRVIDGYGRPMTGTSFQIGQGIPYSIHREPLNPLVRNRITKHFDTGIRSINGLLSFGEGQRIGIMAGSGVGKSVLMGMISRYSDADVNVIALIGERGREVREFLEENLGSEGMKKSVVVVSTGDQSPLSRVRAAHVGTAIAEYFREQGRKVLLLMDSLTRVAMAQREIGLSVGEPPTTKGYTPSVFSLLPKLLERAGNSQSSGSLTGIYTVLVEGDDFNDPISDSARSILDGHINLSRILAERNHFPAIDILSSASRVLTDIASQEHLKYVAYIRDLMSEYQRNEDLINIGAYSNGINPKLDRAIKLLPKINEFLKQDRNINCNYNESLLLLKELTGDDLA